MADIKLVSRELSVENTTYCGTNCIMCPRDKYSFGCEHMNTGLFKSVIDQGVELGMKSLDAGGYGDAFMDPGFEQKINYVKRKYPFVKVYLSSTCQLLNAQRLKWVSKNIDTLRISNYGFTKEVYEKIHRGASFEEVSRNIEALLALPRSRRPYVIMLFLIIKHNEHEAGLWREYWEPKVEEVMIWLPHNWGGKYAARELKAGRSDIEHPKSCRRPFNGSLFIRVNGEVSACCFDFNRELIIGDLRKETLKQVLTGTAMAKLRKMHNDGAFAGSKHICKNCDQIFSREGALIYASNPKRRVGVTISHPDLINDLYKE